MSTFKLRALDLQAQMTKMCERAAYMKVRPNETVYLPRPAVLITGHLSRVYAVRTEHVQDIPVLRFFRIPTHR